MHERLLRRGLTGLCVVAVTACGSSPDGQRAVSPTAPTQTISFTLSGKVFDVTPGGRVPAEGFLLHLALKPFGPGQWTHADTTTVAGGRYAFSQLPSGQAVLVLYSSTHEQVCGAGASLAGSVPEVALDVEITSRDNPQPSPTMPGLRVSGQVYEVTPAGRVGIGGHGMWLEWQPDSTFLVARTNAEGRYVGCGIPAGWPMEFSPWTQNHTYQEHSSWHEFNSDATLDFELKRR